MQSCQTAATCCDHQPQPSVGGCAGAWSRQRHAVLAVLSAPTLRGWLCHRAGSRQLHAVLISPNPPRVAVQSCREQTAATCCAHQPQPSAGGCAIVQGADSSNMLCSSALTLRGWLCKCMAQMATWCARGVSAPTLRGWLCNRAGSRQQEVCSPCRAVILGPSWAAVVCCVAGGRPISRCGRLSDVVALYSAPMCAVESADTRMCACR